MQDIILMSKNEQQANILVTEWMRDFRNVDLLFCIAFSEQFYNFEKNFNTLVKEKYEKERINCDCDGNPKKHPEKVQEMCMTFCNKQRCFEDILITS